MTISGSVARSGHSSSGGSGQVQRSLSLHIQGKFSKNQSFKQQQQQLFSVWSRFCEWSENIAGRDGRQPLAASVFTGIWYLVFSSWYFAAVLFTRIAHLFRPNCFTHLLDAITLSVHVSTLR